MKPIPETPELLAVAERVVWFKPPHEALTEPVHFLAHVMTYGTLEDLRALRGVIGPDEFREVLDNAPPGVFVGVLESQMQPLARATAACAPRLATRSAPAPAMKRAAGRPGGLPN